VSHEALYAIELNRLRAHGRFRGMCALGQRFIVFYDRVTEQWGPA
jgi:hypothetical protein